jgi:hypothetical protein
MEKSDKSYIKPILHKLALAPELRTEEPKGVYPGGRVKQIFAVLKKEMNQLMLVNIWFVMFMLPLLTF